jgi:hypothetical protein
VGAYALREWRNNKDEESNVGKFIDDDKYQSLDAVEKETGRRPLGRSKQEQLQSSKTTG